MGDKKQKKKNTNAHIVSLLILSSGFEARVLYYYYYYSIGIFVHSTIVPRYFCIYFYISFWKENIIKINYKFGNITAVREFSILTALLPPFKLNAFEWE